MQTIALDLKNNPELQSLVADMNPGDKIELTASIKSKDDQSVTLTVETASECGHETETDTETEAEPVMKEKKAKPEIVPDETE